jgi:hypothetical protein
MFNIKRFDPSQPAAGTSAPTTDGLTDLARKIEERQRKRKAGEAGLESTSTSISTPPSITPVDSVPVWKPAEGESPAEREKREKREKRALRMEGAGAGNNVSFDLRPAGPSGTSYVPPPTSFYQPVESKKYENQNVNGYIPSTSSASIHPSRMQQAPMLAREPKEKKEKDPNKEKTLAKKKYLKKKKERSKGKKAGEANVDKRPKKMKKGLEGQAEGTKDSDDSDSDSDDSDDERDRIEAAEKKKQDIIRKKEERKIKRDEKKAEARKVKAEGGTPIAPTPRIIAPKLGSITAAVLETPMEIDITPAEPTVEELEKAVLEAERIVRKETKRAKRVTRRLSPPPPSLISTAPEIVAPEIAPQVEVTSIPEPEPAPLLRLPGATRPAPPSAKTLSALNVHESVRSKQVVDPELKMSLGEDGLGLSERAIKRLGEMDITSAFAGEIFLTSSGFATSQD